MFVLVKFNQNLKENLLEMRKYFLTAVILFEISLNNKMQIRDDLDKILKICDENNFKYKAICVKINNIENSTIGFVNSLRQNFDLVIGFGGLNKVNRLFLESCNVDFLQDPQNSIFKSKIDFIHHFNSGINQVLAKFASFKGQDFIFSLNFTRNKKVFLKEIGRINQNLRFARKYKISSYINFIIEDKFDIKSIVELRGIYSFFDLSTQQKQISFNLIERKIKRNLFEKSSNFIGDGIKIV